MVAGDLSGRASDTLHLRRATGPELSPRFRVSRRADDLHHRFLVEFYQFSARPSVPLRPLSRRVADQPCDRLCSCRISMFRVKDSRTESGDFLRPPRATELVRYREWRVTMSRKIEKEKKISKIDLSNSEILTRYSAVLIFT